MFWYDFRMWLTCMWRGHLWGPWQHLPEGMPNAPIVYPMARECARCGAVRISQGARYFYEHQKRADAAEKYRREQRAKGGT